MKKKKKYKKQVHDRLYENGRALQEKRERESLYDGSFAGECKLENYLRKDGAISRLS